LSAVLTESSIQNNWSPLVASRCRFQSPGTIGQVMRPVCANGAPLTDVPSLAFGIAVQPAAP
jgi:hypothetical protein